MTPVPAKPLHFQCAECGHSLQTIAEEAPCPECGEPCPITKRLPLPLPTFKQFAGYLLIGPAIGIGLFAVAVASAMFMERPWDAIPLMWIGVIVAGFIGLVAGWELSDRSLRARHSARKRRSHAIPFVPLDVLVCGVSAIAAAFFSVLGTAIAGALLGAVIGGTAKALFGALLPS